MSYRDDRDADRGARRRAGELQQMFDAVAGAITRRLAEASAPPASADDP